MKKNIRMTLEYDGSRYDGWQKQGNTDNTIQGKLEAVLFKWTGQEVEVHGSGRTDAGVHARGQTANFHIEEKFCPSAAAAMEYMNRYLPEDIRVIDAKEAPERFHSRLSAVRKTYAYYVETAGYLLGEHDFKSFCSNKRMKKSTVRRIDQIGIHADGTKVVFTYTGNGFLYNMVRILTGTLLEVGLGKRRPEEMKAVLEARNREAAGATAPPEGLFLMQVEYDGEA